MKDERHDFPNQRDSSQKSKRKKIERRGHPKTSNFLGYKKDRKPSPSHKYFFFVPYYDLEDQLYVNPI